jgi:hypothetical protein
MIGSKPYAAPRYRDVKGRRTAYIDEGEGAAIVFQHGQPTSPYVWRNITPHLEGMGRLIACASSGWGDRTSSAPPARTATATPNTATTCSHYGMRSTSATAWCSSWTTGGLFINGEPGAIVRGPVRETIRNWPNESEVTVKGLKLSQEDSPDEVGAAIAAFVGRIRRIG